MSLSVSFCTNSVALPLAYQVNGGNKFIIVFWCLYLSLHPYIQAIKNSITHKENTGVTFWRSHQDKLNNFDCLMAWMTGLWQIHIYLKYKFQKTILAKGQWLTEPLTTMSQLAKYQLAMPKEWGRLSAPCTPQLQAVRWEIQLTSVSWCDPPLVGYPAHLPPVGCPKSMPNFSLKNWSTHHVPLIPPFLLLVYIT